MLKKDGMCTIYMIQHQQTKPKEWVYSSLDHFGYPPGFNASDDCWQETSYFGVYTRKEADKGLKWIQKKNPKYKFRLVCVIMSQQTLEVF